LPKGRLRHMQKGRMIYAANLIEADRLAKIMHREDQVLQSTSKLWTDYSIVKERRRAILEHLCLV
jgi:hypothetical protein